MARREFPLITPFVIPDLPWQFVDYRILDGNNRATAMDRMMTNAQAVASKDVRSLKVERCGASETDLNYQIDTYERLRAAAEARGEKYTWTQFKDSDDFVRNEICPLPRLPILLIAGMLRGVPQGMIGIGNIQIERENTTLVRATAMPAPGFPGVDRSFTQGEVWGKILRFILENNLVMASGPSIDIVGWDLPVSPEYRWSSRENQEMGDTFTEVDAGADRETNPDEAESPTKYRRKGAPAPSDPLVSALGGAGRR